MEPTKKKDDVKIKTIRECFTCKDGDLYPFIKGKQLVHFDNTPYDPMSYDPNPNNCVFNIFFSMLANSFHGHVSEADVSEITDNIIKKTLNDATCLVYSINHNFDAFGRLNIFGSPKKVSLTTDNKECIFSKNFEDEMIFEKEPIMLCLLQKEKLKLVLEYDKVPEIFPIIRCDVWSFCDYTKQRFQGKCYSERYNFYYSDERYMKDVENLKM